MLRYQEVTHEGGKPCEDGLPLEALPHQFV